MALDCLLTSCRQSSPAVPSPGTCQATPPEAWADSGKHGMGIGLSVCAAIIKAHGGFFAAGNDPEGGAVFRFGLPMEEKAYE